MVLEGALVVGGVSIATLAVSRFKCIVKKKWYFKLGMRVHGEAFDT